ncbi:hypothetical protein HQ585_13910 [candidate division KSB1 bacterium]|nr:hypothetical protein [candidate division KSB1 bacterium]
MKQELKTQKPIEFRLRSIQITKCSFQKPKKAILEDQELGFSFVFGVQFDEENGGINIEVGANIYFSPKQKVGIGEIKMVNSFAVNNFKDFVLKKNQFEFPEDFIVMLMSISFSTLRGIIVEKSASTLQYQVILPVINVKEIVDKQKAEK